jgi:hypothetical protein
MVLHSEEIKNIVDAMKSVNGNKTVSSTDLLWYTIHRLDKIEEQMKTFVSKTSCTEKHNALKADGSQRVTWMISICALLVSILGVGMKFLGK